MTFTFLGTGTSVGVPQIGCTCPVCTSTDPRDKRRRCGAYVRSKSAAFLIDTPPEMREAVIQHGISKVDAVVLTHAHMDHVAGFDDIRRFNTLNGGAAMRAFAMEETIEQMHRIFPYISNVRNELGLFRPMINFVSDDRFTIGDVTLERVRVEHGFPCSGYVIDGKIGYVSDCHELSDEAVAAFRGIDVMILNCLREREHPTHLTKERALGYLERIAPKKAYIIHMCHDFSHREWEEKLRGTNVSPAFDGLQIEV